ncbi:hypothetical protein D3C77_803040 [compost metagenome]
MRTHRIAVKNVVARFQSAGQGLGQIRLALAAVSGKLAQYAAKNGIGFALDGCQIITPGQLDAHFADG